MLKNLLKSIIRGGALEPLPPVSPSSEQHSKDIPFTFAADGLWTTHNAGFLKDPLFLESYALGANSGHRICPPENLHIEWRVYICCWAAQQALKLHGDFVECGVSTGIVSRAVANYINFGRQRKRYWLIDTFEGIPLQQASAGELPLARSKNDRHYHDCYPDVKNHFAHYGNVEVIKGRVPEILETLDIRQVAFLHVDMNIAEPEVQAMKHFWSKLVPGAIVIFDDYASMAHQEQKVALDAFANTQAFAIMALPTGQGLALKA